MKIKKITAVTFSPTGNTKKVAEAIAEDLKNNLDLPMERVDLTPPEARKRTYAFGEEDLVIVGTPVYAGRVPNKLLPDLQGILTGGGASAVAVVTFGNRSFDDGLVELRNVLEDDGFHTVGAAAVPARHAFTDALAADRPDASDLQQLAAFADAIEVIIKFRKDEGGTVAVAGNDLVGPYYTPLGTDGKPAKFLKAKPKTDLDKCTHCGLCAALCPVGSISAEDVTAVEGICIKCQACVRGCPTGAKYFDDPAFLSHVAMLEAHYTRRAELKTFL